MSEALFPLQKIESKLKGIQLGRPWLLSSLFPSLTPSAAAAAAERLLPAVGAALPILVPLQVVELNQAAAAATDQVPGCAAASEVVTVELWAQFRPHTAANKGSNSSSSTAGQQAPERYSLRGPAVDWLIERYSGRCIVGVTAGGLLQAPAHEPTPTIAVVQLLLAAPGTTPTPMQLPPEPEQPQPANNKQQQQQPAIVAAPEPAAPPPVPADASLPDGFSLPDAGSVVDAEAQLWKLLGHLQADDELMERAEAAMAALGQPGADASRLQRFTADYGMLQQWVRRRRMDKVQQVLNKLLDNALPPDA